MQNTSKKVARMVAAVLARHGVQEAVLSPGSRNAPLIVAMERHPDISTRVVIDERSAAFIALGISIATAGAPAAIVCTSGTAPLNYGPALAEAFYRHIPLIAVTADRPAEWIDQDDSQTIVQPGIFGNFTKGTFDIPAESDEPDRMWMINRTLNDAMNLATSGCPGPVHINIRLTEPLGTTEETDALDPWGDETRIIQRAEPSVPYVPEGCIEDIAERLAPPAKVLILAGSMEPGNLCTVLRELSRRPNIVVMHEAQSNLHGYGDFITNIDATLRQAGAVGMENYRPDIVLTIGGSVVSRQVKTWMRRSEGTEHWSIGAAGNAVDTFRRLTRQIPYHPWPVLKLLAECVRKRNNSETTAFKTFWLEKSAEALAYTARYADEAPWSDFRAMRQVWSMMPRGWNVQLSNGTAVRYAQLFDYSRAARIDCNRGVSGIDGCTSTAIGMAAASAAPTLLITGDMSMQYDIGALGTTFIPDTFKIIVLNNGGGGIFRFISQTKRLDELERCFVCETRLPLKKLAAAYGFKYLEAADPTQLQTAMTKLISCRSQPVILEITTDGDTSAQVMTNFFTTDKKQ